MGRSGYSESCEGWDLIRWRGAVASAIRGHRGQALLQEMADTLDAMEVRELVAGELESDGQHCALGSVGLRRGIQLAELDPYDREGIAKAFGIAGALVAEIAFVNDGEYSYRHESPAERWQRVRAWVDNQIRKEA